MNDKYYYYSEVRDGWLSIPSKLLYSLWDKSYSIVLEGEGVSREVLTKDYKGFECSEDYRIAMFKIGEKRNTLDPFRLKLLKDYRLHNEWFNIFYDYWKSEEFIVILSKISELRKSQDIIPSKENQFNFLKDRIKDTIIPESPTNIGIEVWSPFIEKCKKIQEEHILNKKKFDI